VTPEAPTGTSAKAITVLSSSRATSRKVGSLAWVVLEELALHAGPNGVAVETSVRELASSLGVGKDAVAAALGRLADLGLVQCLTRRQGGRYAGCTYALDADACRRAGLVLINVPTGVPPCPATPCPVEPDAVAPDTATSDVAREVGSEPAAPFRACRPDPTAQSLFDPPQTATACPPNPLPPSCSLPSTPPPFPPDQPDLPSSPLLPLTPSCQPDALAPEVRRGPVNVPGNGASERSALNANLNGEAGSPC
jgi:DNA-binding transcriptional ArsR family regulator